MTYTKAQVIQALGRVGVCGAAEKVDQFGVERVVEVGLAYRLAQANDSARGPGWIVDKLIHERDVSPWLAVPKEQQESAALHAYNNKCDQEARFPMPVPSSTGAFCPHPRL